MDFFLHLEFSEDIYDDKKQYLYNLNNNAAHEVKISTNEKSIIYDRKNAQEIIGFRNVKIVYQLEGEQCLILRGMLGCNFYAPFGGGFKCKGLSIENVNFEDIKGCSANVTMCNMDANIDNIETMKQKLAILNENDDFVYNISQYDEFMDIFKYYKTLSDSLNNNKNFEIINQSKPYYFVSGNFKEVESEFAQEILNNDGLLIGYKIKEEDINKFKNEILDYSKLVFDITINGTQKEISQIKKVGFENAFLSNFNVVNEKNSKQLHQFIVLNARTEKDTIVLTGELKNDEYYDEEHSFLNLYDMGQKIKIESIENSLKMIKDGGTGSATKLLEYLIGDTPIPNGKNRISLKKAQNYIENLNESQTKAFKLAIDGSPVTLIKGPPGTGKTHVINAIVQYITKELDEKVIISSQTHIAIDNVLDQLMKNYDLVIPNRITNRRNKYSADFIDTTLYKTWGTNFSKHNLRAFNTVLASEIEKQLESFKGDKLIAYAEQMNQSDFKVIGATTTTSAIAGRKGLEVLKNYNWLIIDEVSKCPITEVLRYIPYVDHIIMVGDDYQLAPLLEFSKDDVKDSPEFDEDKFAKLEAMYRQSVFTKVLKKASDSGRLVLLNENYRSVAQVLGTYNVFYDLKLINRRESVKPEKVMFTNVQNEIDYNNSDVMFVEVDGGQEVNDGTSRYNMEEINATSYFIKELMKRVINPEQVTVSAIFPYAAQISRFQKNNLELINQAKKLFKSFEIDTVDAFQGKESDIVLVNTVVTDASKNNFLSEFRRINVSMSRARDKLIVFGNSRTLSKINMKANNLEERHYFKEIITYIRSVGQYVTYKGGSVDRGIESKNTIRII